MKEMENTINSAKNTEINSNSLQTTDRNTNVMILASISVSFDCCLFYIFLLISGNCE